MNCEVMVSTMNQKSKQKIINDLRINKCIIINQITDDVRSQKNDIESNQKFLSFKERGLSRSRNKALKNSTGDICIIADDDMYYQCNYEDIIINAYKKYKKADIIAFVVDNENKSLNKKILKEGKIGLLKTMKLSSVQVTFKRESIINNNLLFDEEFGAGSRYFWGEENIFLFDCMRKGLNIYYVPQKIATLRDTNTSSWDRSNTVDHFNRQGIIYYRMSKVIYPLLIIQFVLRKKRIYINDLTSFQVLKAMFEGVKKYKKGLL